MAVLPWCLMHPIPALAASGRYSRHGHGESQLRLLRLSSPSKDRPPSGTPRSALHHLVRLLRLLLTPAAPSRRLSTPVAHLSPEAGRQASQGKARDLRAIYLSHLRPHPPGEYRASGLLAPLPGCGRLICASCSSGRHFAYSCLQTPPRGDALAVRLTVPITRARRGLSPPSHRPDTISANRCSRTARHAWRTNKKAPDQKIRGFS